MREGTPHGIELDTRAQSTAGGADPHLETVAAGHRATGPRTPDGKATTSRNAYKGGHWLMLRELSRMVNAEVKASRDLMSTIPR